MTSPGIKMKTNKGKSVPEVEEFLTDSSWTPPTPQKPIKPSPRPIYRHNGQETLSSQANRLETEAYLSRFTTYQIPQAQRSVLEPTVVLGNNFNHHFPSTLASSVAHHDAQNQVPTPHYHPDWFGLKCSWGGGSGSSSSSGGSLLLDLNSRAHGMDWNDDPLALWNAMSFKDLLALKDGVTSVFPVQSTISVGGGSGDISPGLDSQAEAATRYRSGAVTKNQDLAGELDSTGGEVVLQGGSSGLSHNHFQNQNNLNSCISVENRLPTKKRQENIESSFPEANTPVFAPPTPNPHKAVEKNSASAEANLLASQNINTPNAKENPVSASSRSIDLYKLLHARETPQPANSVPVFTGDYIAENNEIHGAVDHNKLSEQKPRRKKHRPKVVKESNPEQSRKHRMPKKPIDPNEPPRAKRKYVRKNKASLLPPPTMTPPTREEAQSLHPTVPERSANSCRRALNFGLDDEPRGDNNSPHRSNRKFHSEQLPQRILCGVGIQSSFGGPSGKGNSTEAETTQAYTAYELSCRMNQMLKDYISMPGNITPINPQPIKVTNPLERKFKTTTEQNSGRKCDNQAGSLHNSKESAREIFTENPNSSTCASSNKEQARGLKRVNSCTAETPKMSTENTAARHSSAWLNDPISLGSASINVFPGMYFPEICKKKRTEKNLKPNTTSILPSALHFNARALATNQATIADNHEEKMQYTHTWANLERLKKRSKGPNCICDLDTFKGIAECKEILTPQAKERRKYKCKDVGASTTPPSCRQALAEVINAKRATNRKSKTRTIIVKSVYSSLDIMNMQHSLLSHKDKQYNNNLPGTFLALPWTETISVDAIIEGLKQLDINREGSNNSHQKQNALIPYHEGIRKQQNALVVYRRDGMMIASEATSDQARRRKSRARVELDNETERVWKLLLQDINSEGIDGTDEEKAKWWEEERKVFHGRVDSFIARMRLVQGDRGFSPWKGSVVDSVVGVFLTQNVSDHLSSSAFMSMAARFPILSENVRTHYEEEAAPLVEEPKECIEELDYTVAWTEKRMDVPVCDRSSKTVHETDLYEEKEVVDNKELHGATSPKDGSSQDLDSSNSNQAKANDSRVNRANSITAEAETETASALADARATEDVSSSQHSVVSSQNSADSPSTPPVRKFGQNSESNSDTENLTTSSKLNCFKCSASFVELLKMAETPLLNGAKIHAQNQSLHQNHDQTQQEDTTHDKREKGIIGGELPYSSLEAQNASMAVHQLKQMAELHLQILDGESMFSQHSARKDKSCTTEKTAETPMLHRAFIQKDKQTFSENHNLAAPCKQGIFRDELSKSSLEGSNLSSTMYQQFHSQMLDEVSTFSDNLTRKDENCTAEQSEATTESAVQFSLQEKTSENIKRLSFCTQNICACYVLEGEEMVMQSVKQPIRGQQGIINPPTPGQECLMGGNPKSHTSYGENVGVTESTSALTSKVYNEHQPAQPVSDHNYSWSKPISKSTPTQKTGRTGKGKKAPIDWDSLRREAQSNDQTRERTANTMDSVNWEAVRCASVEEVADTIKERGMNNVLAERIQFFLNRLVSDHGSIDLEWLRDVPPDKAKEYLLSVRGLGLKSVECVRLLTLHHLAFPVDTNVGRIAVRLGWVPLQPLPESLQLHLLEQYPVLESIQKYLWPRLCKLEQRTLYELHYHMITFGKVFCTKKQPNCNACPLRGECRHFASAFASARLSLPGPEERCIVTTTQSNSTQQDFQAQMDPLPIPLPLENQPSEAKFEVGSSEPIVEVPASPEPEQTQTQECDIEDIFYDDPNEIPTIKLNIAEFSQTLQTYMQSLELHNGDMSKALVALTAEAASIPTPKLKNVSRLRTEHHVYELPDTHPLLRGLPIREQDDPCSYLLAIWSPGETADSIQPPERKCNTLESSQLCDDETCFCCSSHREANSQLVRATLLIPCRTAMRGSFPLNGTYFQVNEVFADHDSSLIPMEVPRQLIWNLPRRTVYFGTSIPTIFRGLSTEDIQHCFWRGYVCVRGFDQKTRAPRPLTARLHFPASKMPRSRGNNAQEDGWSIKARKG